MLCKERATIKEKQPKKNGIYSPEHQAVDGAVKRHDAGCHLDTRASLPHETEEIPCGIERFELHKGEGRLSHGIVEKLDMSFPVARL